MVSVGWCSIDPNFPKGLPSVAEMMESIQNGEIDCVIVRDLSRLGRDYVQTGEHLRKIFPKLGVRFISILDNIDTIKDNDLGGMLDVTLKTILNDSYSRDISKKTRSALRIKQQNGDYVGACPIYGYKKSVENKNQLVIDDETVGNVRQIFTLKKDGYSACKIADIFNEKGILSPLAYKKQKGLPTPKGGFSDIDGCQWSATTILRILQDSTYIGTLTQGKETTYSYKLKEKKNRPQSEWAVTPNAHQPIISKNDFDLVQKLMNLDTRTSPQKENLYLFSGLLICDCCGCPMVRKTVPHKEKKYVYYACNTGRKNGCTTKMIKEETLVEVVKTSIQSFVENVISLDDVLDLANTVSVKSSMQDGIMTQIKGLLIRKQEIIDFKSTLYENLLGQLITKDEYKELKQDYDRDLEKLAQQEEVLQEEYQKSTKENQAKPEWIEEYREFQSMATISRRAVVQLIQSISIGEKIHLNFRCQDEYNTIVQLLAELEEVG